MIKQDRSMLFDAKMELHPEEESFAEPTISMSENRKRRCRWDILLRVGLVLLLITAAFIGGYLVRRAVFKSKCKSNSSGSNEDGKEKLLEEILADMSPKGIEESLRNFTLKPHHASSARNTELAHFIHDKWKEYGFDVKLVKYNVLLSFPEKGKINGASLLNDLNKTVFETAKQEKILEPSENSSDALPPFSAYSPSGVATGELVFVNYGRVKDFEELISKGINCSGKIAIAKYGRTFRGDKVTNAHKFGAKAVLLYNDPKDYAPVPDDDLYPNSWWLPRSGVQRGSILLGTGDPLTPRYPSKDGVYRSKTGEITFPSIPTHPISAEDAERFLRLLGGVEAPAAWQGGLNITYRLGPGFREPHKNWSVRVETNNNHTRRDIYNVIGVIKGSQEPDRLVLMGNHRDAWVFGGVDPSSGTACLMEISKAFAKKFAEGWRPRRSIVLCSWGGEEYGLLGSTEWVEDNIHTLSQRAVAYLNVDSPIRGNYSLYVMASPLLHKVLYDASKQVKNPVRKSETLYSNWLDKFPAASGRTPKIRPLGSGSDYAAFYQRVGLPSADIRYVFDKNQFRNVTSYPTYHSIYDTFEYVKRFVDPQFTTHLAVAQTWGSAAFLLAETTLLPINCSDYAVVLNQSAMEIQRRNGQNLTKQGISLDYLMAAVKRFEKASTAMQSLIDSTDINDLVKVRLVNDRLSGLEKTFINPEGLPGRPLYWHTIFAPSLHNSYASATFPGLHDALLDAPKTKDWTLVEEQLSNVLVAIEWAAKFLESTI